MTTTLLHGDCRDLLKTLPDRSVQCCITSPPYYGLRDYGVDGQIGLEQTPAAYVAALVDVFREVRRVLRDDGTLWLNLGDSYANDTKWGGQTSGKHAGRLHGDTGIGRMRTNTGLKSKDMIGIPWRVAFALQDDGWYLRSDIIWHKPNPMPESVTDRPTKAHEYLFLLAKSERYYYDAAAIAEPATGTVGNARSFRGGGAYTNNRSFDNDAAVERETHGNEPNESGTRNRRTVWTIATRPYADAHFATFPEALVEPCILAGSAAQACEHCGAPWVRERETTGHVNRREPAHVPGNTTTKVDSTGWAPTSRPTDLFIPSCACANNTGNARSTVLDPFMGSGTVARVAERLQRHAIGCELNAEYIDLQEKRTDKVQVEMFV